MRRSRNFVTTIFSKKNNNNHAAKPIKLHKLQILNSYNTVQSTKHQTPNNTQTMNSFGENLKFCICSFTGNIIGLSIVSVLYSFVFIS
jgi:hypothetical protein